MDLIFESLRPNAITSSRAILSSNIVYNVDPYSFFDEKDLKLGYPAKLKNGYCDENRFVSISLPDYSLSIHAIVIDAIIKRRSSDDIIRISTEWVRNYTNIVVLPKYLLVLQQIYRGDLGMSDRNPMMGLFRSTANDESILAYDLGYLKEGQQLKVAKAIRKMIATFVLDHYTSSKSPVDAALIFDINNLIHPKDEFFHHMHNEYNIGYFLKGPKPFVKELCDGERYKQDIAKAAVRS